MKTCTECNQAKEVTEFYKNRTSKDGLRGDCKGCVRARTNARYENNREHLQSQISIYYKTNREKVLAQRGNTLNGRFATYKAGAKKRSLAFGLTKDQFAAFWQLPCNYCGQEIATIGIDRVDSSLGYVVGNCVPCCIVCNKIKLDHDVDSMNNHIFQMLKHQGLI